jgi:hypothetical protein
VATENLYLIGYEVKKCQKNSHHTMNTTLKMVFYLKKPKNYVSGPIPIYLRLTLNSQRAEISTGRESNPDKWSSAGYVTGTKEDVKELNAYLDAIKSKVYEAHRYLLIIGDMITVESIKNKYLGKEERVRLLIEIFQDHNNQVEALVGKEFAAGTLERYKTSLKHTQDYLKWKYHLEDIDIRKVDHAFITEYEFYLRSVRNCGYNSAVKYIKNFGKIIRICLANGWLEKNPSHSKQQSGCCKTISHLRDKYSQSIPQTKARHHHPGPATCQNLPTMLFGSQPCTKSKPPWAFLPDSTYKYFYPFPY